MTISIVSNQFKYELFKQLETHVLKAVLMVPAFQYDKDAHTVLADIEASQLPTGNGYTQNDKVLLGLAVTKDDATDRAVLTCENPIWKALGGALGPFGSLVIIDTTMTNNVVVGCVKYMEVPEDTPITVTEDVSFTATGIKIQLN